ncbi:MAG TPA: HD domain-containing phosphohydrolase [Mobilitalea sp.]|nr:HD domain-containing phosphohydrolase [Mobilitalea sp.]
MHRIRTTEAKPGMILAKTIHSPVDNHMLLSYGTVLKDTMIKKLASSGINDIVVTDRYTLIIKPVDQIATSLKANYHQVINKYSSNHMEANICDAMISIASLVKNTVDRICKNEIILEFCLQMKILKDNRLYNHSILTSVFSGLIAGAMGQDNIYDIMVGGLLHDIGCLEMQVLIGKKDLKGQNELLWKEHPTYGYYFALQQNIPRQIAEIILHHHEKWDGTGYPKQLKGNQIPLGSRIVNVSRKISGQIHFDNMQPYESMEYLYCGSNIFFDKTVVDAFVNNITLYPLGAFVRLSTGEVGIISNVRKNHGPRPVISVHYNRFGKPISEPKIIDLGNERTIFISEVLV